MSEDLTPEGRALTELISVIFRANGAILTAGDGLSKDLGLTSARWQVLAAMAGGALTVSQAARRMGLTRQSVQRVADDLVHHGLAAKQHNPDHKRAPLIDATPLGNQRLEEITRRQRIWVNALAKGLGNGSLEAATRVMTEITTRLENNAAEK